ncbi:MAG: helix-turn-helix transcriptional regulator [Eggerthellaceae bacterium]|nr:helix-turn-helix transcriptional regulator [Eggerthellaceae bacterium]
MGQKIQSSAELGAAIRARRKSQGLTQQELAGFSGCSAKFLTDLENGKPTVRLDKVLKIVMMLGMDFYLEGREDTRW